MESKLREEIRALVQNAGDLCISIYIPTHRAGLETQQDPIRLKNLLNRVQEQLEASGMRTPEAVEMLGPARQLLDDGFFWRDQEDGLALFIAPGFFRSYRVPIHFDELAVVNNQFMINPLFPLLNGDGRFYVLAVSQRQVRLLRCTHYDYEEVELEGVPKSMDDALQLDEASQQGRFHTRVKGTMPTQGESIFRGHGSGVDDSKTGVLRYLIMIDEGLHDCLKEENAPLVVVGVDYVVALYREANTYRHLLKEAVTGNPDGLTSGELHEDAWAVVEPFFESTIEDAIARYGETLGTGLASNDIRTIVPAAYNGRVEALFLPEGSHIWGRFDPETQEVELHEEAAQDDEDLLNFAAVQTFMNSGEVYTLDPARMPGGGESAASFRY